MARHDNLFDSLRIGAIDAPNRVLMAPLTRNRSLPDGRPWGVAATYYAQRASAGLVITEATQISAEGKGYLNTPGIHTDEHVEGWKYIVDAVHAAGGRIACQLWHVGRISHVSLQPDGQQPVAPSAIRADTQTFTAEGFTDVSEPRALETDEIPRVIEDYRHAARCAKAAGFDAVEVHAANGYLLDQFIQDGTNKRTDEYGGSIGNRIRLPYEVTEAVAEIMGADRTGVRVSPNGDANDIHDSDVAETFGALYKHLDHLGLAYLHVMEQFPGTERTEDELKRLEDLRGHWSGVYIANGGFDAAQASAYIERGRAHAVAFGRPFIANPDLPDRYRRGAPLNEPDQDTFYGGNEKGYTDYPTLGEAA